MATDLLRMFAPQVAVYGFISIATGILQAKRKFGPPMFAPIFNNLVVIAVLLSLPHITNDLSLRGIQAHRNTLYLLGFGTTAGVLAMGLVLVPYLMKISRGRLRWVWNPRHEAVKTVLKMSGWTAGFVAANQVALWVTLVLANGRSGDVTAFLSAYTFFILPHGIFTVSVVSALAPELAERWTKHDTVNFRHQIVQGLRLVAVVLLPASVGYAILAHPISDAILLHGNLSASAAHTTGSVLAWMAVGLPGFSAFIFLTRVFQSMQNARTVFFLYLWENLLNVVTALILYPLMGVNGLALSQSLSYAIAAVIGVVLLRSRAQGLEGKTLLASLTKISIATTLMAFVVVAATTAIDFGVMIEVIAGVVAGAITYVACARVLKVSELQLLVRRRTRNS